MQKIPIFMYSLCTSPSRPIFSPLHPHNILSKTKDMVTVSDCLGGFSSPLQYLSLHCFPAEQVILTSFPGQVLWPDHQGFAPQIHAPPLALSVASLELFNWKMEHCPSGQCALTPTSLTKFSESRCTHL